MDTTSPLALSDVVRALPVMLGPLLVALYGLVVLARMLHRDRARLALQELELSILRDTNRRLADQLRFMERLARPEGGER